MRMIISRNILKALYEMTTSKASNWGADLYSIQMRLGLAFRQLPLVDAHEAKVRPLDIIVAPPYHDGHNYQAGRPVLLTAYYRLGDSRKSSHVSGICFGNTIYHGNWITSKYISAERLNVRDILPLIPDGDLDVPLEPSYYLSPEGAGIGEFAKTLEAISRRLAVASKASH